MSARAPPHGIGSRQTALAALLSCLAGTAWSACLPNRDPRFADFNRMMLTQPAAAARAVETRLAAADAQESAFRAQLYVALADAHSALEQHQQAAAAIAAGLALAQDPVSPAYLNLVVLDALTPKSDAGIRASRQRAERLLKSQPGDSQAQACVLLTLGLLEHLADRPDQASIYLTRAYRASAGPAREATRVLVAQLLSMVLQALHDFPGALRLNQEVIESHLRQGAEFDLATDYFLRGFLFSEQGKPRPALAELARSRALSVKMQDTIGVAYTDLLRCKSELALGRPVEARANCERALQVFEAAGTADPIKQTLLALAQVDFAERAPRTALQRLDRVLADEGRDIPPLRVVQAYELRSRVHRELGNYPAAIADADQYIQRFKATREDERAREAAAMRARFETDREIERNDFLKRELATQAERLRWMIGAAIGGALVILLLVLLLVSNRRKKRLLARLATEDELTGLPNRRHVLESAMQSFAATRERGAHGTLALLDMDHFKRINDAFGHAAGDFVLREFARIARANVRSGDLVGRWGGEEFLLVMPDTPLDVALAAVERIRTATGLVQGGPLPAGYPITLSAGIASDEGRASSLEDLVAEADAALYEAKRLGRNRAQVAERSYRASATIIRRNLRRAGLDMATGTQPVVG